MPFLFPENNPDYLRIADKPLSQPDAQIQTLTPAEIQNRFGFQYHENIEITSRSTPNMLPHGNSMLEAAAGNSILLSKVQERLRNPLTNALVVCHINDEVGHGVFTTEFIPAGTVICLYAGTLQDSAPKTDNARYISAVAGSSTCINANATGGIGRFIQHMPKNIQQMCDDVDKGDLDQFVKTAFIYGILYNTHVPPSHEKLQQDKARLKALIQSRESHTEQHASLAIKRALSAPNTPIAAANTVSRDCYYGGYFVQCILTCRDIAPNEQLGISRSWQYSLGNQPTYFHRDTGYPLATDLFTQHPTTYQAQPKNTKAPTMSGFKSGFLNAKKTQASTKPAKEAPTPSDFKRGFLNQDKTPAPAKPAAHQKEEKAPDSDWKKGFLL